MALYEKKLKEIERKKKRAQKLKNTHDEKHGTNNH